MGHGETLLGRFPPKRALVSLNTAATHEVVAAVPEKRIVVLNAILKVANGQSLTWIRGTSTPISGTMVFATSDLLYAAVDPFNGILETGIGERLALTLAAATQVSGHITYVEI